MLDQTEMELIHSVFDFSETPVKKVMVPRPKIFALDVDTPPGGGGAAHGGERLLAHPRLRGAAPTTSSAWSTSRTPCACSRSAQPVVLRKILQPVHFVPETKKVGALLKELQKRRTHMALVIDEHGSVTGLVTLEDLLEEIVGEIQDEYDWEERRVERLRDGSLVVEGTMPAAELRDALRHPHPGVRGVRDRGRLHAGLAGLGAARRRGGGGRGLPADGGGRRAEPDQQGQDRERPGHASRLPEPASRPEVALAVDHALRGRGAAARSSAASARASQMKVRSSR